MAQPYHHREVVKTDKRSGFFVDVMERSIYYAGAKTEGAGEDTNIPDWNAGDDLTSEWQDCNGVSQGHRRVWGGLAMPELKNTAD